MNLKSKMTYNLRWGVGFAKRSGYKAPKMDLELLHRHALLYMNTVLSFLIVTEHDAQSLTVRRLPYQNKNSQR
jgi:hypothetical protein